MSRRCALDCLFRCPLFASLLILLSCSASTPQQSRSTPLTDLSRVAEELGVSGEVQRAPGETGDDVELGPEEESEESDDGDHTEQNEAMDLGETRGSALSPIIVGEWEYENATESIIDPAGSMTHFYRRLAAVARREPGTVARISVYGDSINGADFVTSALRRSLQKRFGDSGKGWVPIGTGWPTQQHQDVQWNHYRDWLVYVVNRGRAPGDRYGLAGVLSYNRTRHSRATFSTVTEGPVGTRVSRFRLFYQAWRRGGVVELSVDLSEPVTLPTRSEQMDDRVYEIRVPDGPHSLKLGVHDGRVRLYGVVMERDGPGIVVDALMLIGARGRRLALFNAEHFARQVELRQTDLLVFWLGVNDTESSYFDRDGFVNDYGAGIANARTGRPEASCLVVSIPDIGENPGGRTRRRVPIVVAAQQEIAAEQGCAFLNYFEAMGGAGTMRRWFRSRPRRVSADYIHPTVTGARIAGNLLYQLILRGFAEYVASNDTSLQTVRR